MLPVRPKSSVLLTLLLAAGCASLSGRATQDDASSGVIVHEPPVPAGASIAPQAPIPAEGDELALGIAHMVANDGRWSSDVIDDDVALLPVICRSPAFGYRHDPLSEGGVYRAFDRRDVLGSWVFVGIALGGDGLGSSYYEGSCGSRWTDRALASRVGRLAPDVAGRDTSHLFTTARRTVPNGGASLVGTIVDQFIPRSAGHDDTGRTAKPRTAQPSGAPAPASSDVPAAPASAKPAPKPTTDDRSGGSDRPSDGRARPWGSRQD